MFRRFFTRAFRDKNADAVLIYFSAGIRIVTGTTETFIDKVLFVDFDCPFVLRTDPGELAVGGVLKSTQPIFKKYAVNAVLNCVKKNHDDDLRCSITPVHSGMNNQSLLLVCPFIPSEDEYDEEDYDDDCEEDAESEEDAEADEEVEEEIQYTEADYARLEAFVLDWIESFPGMYV